MNLIIRHEADEEFYLACADLETEVPGLGVRFANEVQRTLRQIARDPERERVRMLREHEYRRVNLKSFPYFVAYIFEEETVFVIAISHGHRDPEHWLERLEP